MKSEPIDVAIVGGGPAGLSAALWLGRYRRTAIVFDAGEPRNEPAWAVHGYPGLPDPAPLELRRRLVQQALGAGARIVNEEVKRVGGAKNEFTVSSAGGETRARRLVLAYGLRDYLPEIDGVAELYGTSVFHCGDCDGPAVADTRIGVLGWNRHGANMALYLRHFSENVVLLTHGRGDELSEQAQSTLRSAGVEAFHAKVRRVGGHGGNLTQAELEDGKAIRLDALFFHLGSEPRCEIGEQLGCALDADGYITVDRGQETSIPGIHAAGDITGQPHLAAIAAAEGVRAALAIHRSLLPEWRQV
ncbi:MAG: NAD(P)/FAD-dependent oxidoreductase [Gemmatimonadota bacterium]